MVCSPDEANALPQMILQQMIIPQTLGKQKTNVLHFI